MRLMTLLILFVLLIGCASSTTDTLQVPENVPTMAPGELKVDIRPPDQDLFWTGEKVAVDVEGFASTIGGVRYLDMMLVMDTSQSLKRTDPEDFRSAAAIALVKSLSPKADAQIGVVGFGGSSELTQALTQNRSAVAQALQSLPRKGGTNLAAGILTALEEFQTNGRPDSSRVVMLFTDGKSNQKKARDATRLAQAQGVVIQTLLLGADEKGESIMQEIANGTGGHFVQVTEPSKLPEAFKNLRTTGVERVDISVNGAAPVPADLAGGTFSAQIPLELGENRITALAKSLDDQSQSASVKVNVHDASCAALEVSALKDGQPTLSLNDRAVQIVVDASRSMWGQIDGQSKMAIAQETLHDASNWLPDDLQLALRAYGNTSKSEANNCSDSSLLVPFSADNRESIRTAVGELQPRGQTPIAYALEAAAEDFANLEGERTLVLVTDGIESCGGDPVAVARELRARNIAIHLIGFGLDRAADEDTASLQAIAEASGGQFLTASNADELKAALENTVGTRFRVYEGSELVTTGMLGSSEPVYLPQGNYRVALDSVPPREVAVQLAPRDDLTVTLAKTDGAVTHSEQRDQLQPTACRDAVAANKLKRRDQAPSLSKADPEQQLRYSPW